MIFEDQKWNYFLVKSVPRQFNLLKLIIIFLFHILGDPEVTANLCCNFAYLYW